MHLIERPQVYCVGRQIVNDFELDRFLADHGIENWSADSSALPAEVLSETAGRVCYMSFEKPRPGGNKAYIQHIKEVGHGSVLEHGVWNLLVTGVSRSLTHEFVRHRSGFGYSQLSQRYVDESKTEVVVPPALMEEVFQACGFLSGIPSRSGRYADDTNYDMEIINEAIDKCTDGTVMAGLVWLRSMRQTAEDYQFLTKYVYDRELDKERNRQHSNPEPNQLYLRLPPELLTSIRKEARGTARSVLPNATETKLFVTANSRALRHFLEQRGSKFAEVEIRRLANQFLDVLLIEAPTIFGDYDRTPLADGTFEITTKYVKV